MTATPAHQGANTMLIDERKHPPKLKWETEDLPPLPEPDLEIGTKLLPYEERQFNTPGMAARLGYANNLRQYVKLEKIRAYGDARASAAVAQERERCAELLESQHTWITNVAAAAVIRKGK